MNTNYTIIDVEPIESSNTRLHSAVNNNQPTSNYEYKREGGYSTYTVYTNVGSQAAATKSAEDVLSDFTQIAIGAGLVLLGIPMLILPGPGLLAICGGLALASNGMRKVFG